MSIRGKILSGRGGRRREGMSTSGVLEAKNQFRGAFSKEDKKRQLRTTGEHRSKKKKGEKACIQGLLFQLECFLRTDSEGGGGAIKTFVPHLSFPDGRQISGRGEGKDFLGELLFWGWGGKYRMWTGDQFRNFEDFSEQRSLQKMKKTVRWRVY